jgi:uncharacterized protein involved in exopolysaccharide biosynthesis
MAPDAPISEDEIDIREIVNTLYRYKWFILGITLVAVLIVFVYTKFLQPRLYTAQAQVLITKPLFTTNLDPSIEIVPQTPEGTVLRDLALAADLLWGVYTTPDIIQVLDEGQTFPQFADGMSAKLAGTSKLILSVSADKPETAAAIVNVWAEQFAARVNSIFSVNQDAVTSIVKEIEKARDAWDAAETELLANLADGMGIVEKQKVELASKSAALDLYARTLIQLDLLASDTRSLQARLAHQLEESPESPLGVEYRLGLISLYQRAAGGRELIQVQLTEPTTMGVQTAADAQASLEALTASLGTQKKELMDSQDQLRQEITQAAYDLETAEYQLKRLTTERDLTLETYQALSAQLEETNIDLARGDLTAKIASSGLAPQLPASNRTLIKTLIAGVLAFAMACFGALLVSWWKKPALA